MMASCDSVCIGEWIFLILWLVSVPIYCMVIYTIVKKRKTKFKGEFWLLTISLFVADILHLCQTMWGKKLSSMGYLPPVMMRKPKVFGWLMMAPRTSFKYAEIMGVVFISFNRYVAIMKPLQYKSLWTRKITVCCICAQWVVAGCVFLRTSTVRYTLTHDLYNNGSTFTARVDNRDKKSLTMFVAIVIGLCGLMRIPLFGFLYGRMLYHVYKENEKSKRNNEDRQPSPFNKAEINLAIMGSALALCDIAITLHILDVAAAVAGGLHHTRFGMFRLECINDIYGWMNGWLLLVCCEEVRNQFRNLFGCKKATQVHPIQKSKQSATQTHKKRTVASSKL